MKNLLLYIVPLLYVVVLFLFLTTFWSMWTTWSTPDGAQVRAICVRHGGIDSATLSSPLLGETFVVCRDGYGAYPR